jgi:hypothetical protein
VGNGGRNSSNNTQGINEHMDVISFTPRKMRYNAEVYHPIIINAPLNGDSKISENVQESLNSLKTILLFNNEHHNKKSVHVFD